MTAPALNPGPGRRGYSDEFYRWIAARYVELAGSVGRRIAPILAEETGGTVYAVHRWVAVSRAKGFLPPVDQIRYTRTARCSCGRLPAEAAAPVWPGAPAGESE